MKTQTCISVTALRTTLIILSALLVLSLPSITNAQADHTHSSVDESIADLDAEIQSLRDEVQALRTEVNQLRSSGVVNTTESLTLQQNTFTTILRLGDSGEEVERLQEALIGLGFDIPAGVTGNFFSQTEAALNELQEEHDLSPTGILDQTTINTLSGLLNLQTIDTPHDQNDTDPEPLITPVITPDLRIFSPIEGLSPNAGTEIPLRWSSTYAPAGAKISFRLINNTTGINQPIYETESLSGTYQWILPSNMPGENEIISKMTYQEEESSTPIVLVSQSRSIYIYGGTVETTTGSGTNDNVAFYTGTEFADCMSDYPETVALISGWVNGGLLLYEFPWNEITGSAADKVIECEGDEFGDNYGDPSYVDCVNFTTESACSLEA